MVRFVLGLVMLGVVALSAAFLVLLLGTGEIPQAGMTTGDYVGGFVASALVWGIPGALLTFFGHRYLRRRRLVLEEAGRLAQESGSIDPSALVSRVGLDLGQVRTMLEWGKKKGRI